MAFYGTDFDNNRVVFWHRIGKFYGVAAKSTEETVESFPHSAYAADVCWSPYSNSGGGLFAQLDWD